jgi:hypothetical protein
LLFYKFLDISNAILVEEPAQKSGKGISSKPVDIILRRGKEREKEN